MEEILITGLAEKYDEFFMKNDLTFLHKSFFRSIKDPISRTCLISYLISKENYELLRLYSKSCPIHPSNADLILRKLGESLKPFSSTMADLAVRLISREETLFRLRINDYQCFLKIAENGYVGSYSKLDALLTKFISERKAKRTDKEALAIARNLYSLPVRNIVPDRFKGYYPTRSYKQLEKIGRGAFGRVHRALNMETLEIKAVKTIHLENHAVIDDYLQEICIHSSIPDHENIIKLEEIFLRGKFMYIVLPFVDGGSIFATLNPAGKVMSKLERLSPFSESEIAFISYQVLQGLFHLHSQMIVHRDIKSDNILWDLNGTVKIADFGLSKKMGHPGQWISAHEGLIGTSYWLSPEIIEGRDYDDRIDIWAFGIFILELLKGGNAPHMAKYQPEDVLEHLIQKPLPKMSYLHRYSPALQDFVKRCLIVDNLERPRATELLQHPFVNITWSTADKIELGFKLQYIKRERIVHF